MKLQLNVSLLKNENETPLKLKKGFHIIILSFHLSCGCWAGQASASLQTEIQQYGYGKTINSLLSWWNYSYSIWRIYFLFIKSSVTGKPAHLVERVKILQINLQLFEQTQKQTHIHTDKKEDEPSLSERLTN